MEYSAECHEIPELERYFHFMAEKCVNTGINATEVQDLKNRKLADINLEIINEHFCNMRAITEKVTKSYIQFELLILLKTTIQGEIK